MGVLVRLKDLEPGLDQRRDALLAHAVFNQSISARLLREDRVLMTRREQNAELSSCLGRFYLRAMQDVPIDHLSIDGHQHPQVNVHAVRIQTHQSEDVKEELGPQSQILHHKRQGQNLRRLIPDEGLLWMHIHQLDEHTNMQTCDISNAHVV